MQRRSPRRLAAVVIAALLACAPGRTIAATGAAADAADKPDFAADQIEQMVAPIALFPDTLLTNVLMASTYPIEVVQADRWVKANPKVKGADLDKAMEGQKWDDSVKALVRVPDVLDRMSKNLDWTSDLGDAFLGQQEDVLAAVQKMRRKAQDNGALKTTKEQQVVVEKVVEKSVEKEVIRVVPADPQVVYVPTYSAPAVYGSAWSYPSYYYPPMYTYPPGYVATASLVSFGVGMAVGAAVWGNCNWGGGWSNCCGGYGDVDVDIDSNRNVNRNSNRNTDRGQGQRGQGGRGQGQQRWNHNPQHRGGQGYRNQNVSQRYQGAQNSQRRGMNQQQARGYQQRGSIEGGRGQGQAQGQGRGQGQARAQAQGRGGGQGVRQPSAGAQSAGQRGGAGSRSYDRGGSQGAFGGGSGGFERSASQRGASSRGASSYSSRGGGSYGGGGSRSYGGGGGSRSGGGFSGGGGRGGGGGGRGGGGRRR